MCLFSLLSFIEQAVRERVKIKDEDTREERKIQGQNRKSERGPKFRQTQGSFARSAFACFAFRPIFAEYNDLSETEIDELVYVHDCTLFRQVFSPRSNIKQSLGKMRLILPPNKELRAAKEILLVQVSSPRLNT